MRGLTEADNLITLCHTCHCGLDPHFEVLLLGMVPGDAPVDTIDINLNRKEHEEGVQLYRSLSASAIQPTLALPPTSSNDRVASASRDRDSWDSVGSAAPMTAEMGHGHQEDMAL